jgi:hypothetical protein
LYGLKHVVGGLLVGVGLVGTTSYSGALGGAFEVGYQLLEGSTADNVQCVCDLGYEPVGETSNMMNTNATVAMALSGLHATRSRRMNLSC